MLKVIEINPEFVELVKANDGYCPCKVFKIKENKCPCKEFRDQNEPGPCICGRYEKVEVDDT